MPSRMKNIFPTAFICILLISCGQNPSSIDLTSQTREAWNALNDPKNLKDDYEVTLSKLPISADLSNKPWSDTYWPNYQGGLANRWNDPEQPDAFEYKLFSANQVSSLTEEDLKHLSPAEKYDIYLGRLDFPFVRSERRRTKADDPSWYGLCHGWAPASINYSEPNPVTVEGAGGIKVPFGSSDIKALLLFAQQYGDDNRMAGGRCNDNDGSGPACKDINAGSFHVILTNQIGIKDQGFVADIAKGEEVWNQPVYGFTSEMIGETTEIPASAAPGTVKIASIQTSMRYISESAPNWDPLPFDKYPYIGATKSYDYTIELNEVGEIIGGEWVSTDHPDFFWTQAPFVWNGYFKKLQNIYDASVAHM
jgi:hypothetical protein